MANASVRDIARRAGVSVGTVSNVLNRPAIVAPATVAAVQAAIAELGFVRNDAARQLRVGRSRAVGFVVYDVGNPFFADVARGAEDRAAEAGLSIIMGNSDDKAERESAYLDLFDEQRMHGVLISPIGDATARIRQFRARGIPAVLVDRTTRDNSISSVSVDDVAGGKLAASHLLAIGRRRFAFVGGLAEIRQVADRLEGARCAVAAEVEASLEVIETIALTVVEGRRVGADILDRSPGDRPDAIFADNDLVAVGLLQALFMQGAVIVPDEIALIGATAVDILLQLADDSTTEPRQVVFQPELIARASTGFSA
jgi:LacI family transcriptional regulator